jgi:hypothetical protein
MKSRAWWLWGLSGLLPLSAGPENVLYREDFEEGTTLDQWITAGGRWAMGREANGVLRQEQTDLEDNALAAVSWADYTVTAVLRSEAHGAVWGMGLIAHWQDEFNHYRLIYSPGRLSLLKVQQGEIQRLAVAAVDFSEKAGYFFSLQAVREGPGVTLRGKVWKEGEEEPGAWRVTATDLQDPFTHGPAGFWTGQAAVRFDSFRLVLTPPAETAGLSGLVEDFERQPLDAPPSGWLVRRGNWKVVQAETRVLQQSQATDGVDFNGNAYAVAQGWAHYTVQARIRVTEYHGDWGVGLIGYWQDANHHYRLRTVADTLFLARRSGEGKIDHLQAVPLVLQPQTWYIFKLRLENAPQATRLRGKVWREDQREPGEWLLEAEDSSPSRYTSGTVGFWTLRAAGSFDNLVVVPNR